MSELPVIVYTPESALRHPSYLFMGMFRDVWAGRGLAWRLAVRDISAQYRQALLGILWAFILPLANTATWLFLNGSGIVSVADTVLPYPVYVFTGTMLWAIFMEALNAPLQQATAAKSMLAKINFPREALVLTGVYITLFNALIKITLMLIVLIIILDIRLTWGLVLFPLGIFSLVLAGTTLGLLLTPVGLLYTDIGKSVPLVMQFLMYVTPVVFPMPKTGLALEIIRFNPLTPLIVSTRDWLTGLSTAVSEDFLMLNLIFLGLFFLLGIVYRTAMPILIERMSA